VCAAAAEPAGGETALPLPGDGAVVCRDGGAGVADTTAHSSPAPANPRHTGTLVRIALYMEAPAELPAGVLV